MFYATCDVCVSFTIKSYYFLNGRLGFWIELFFRLLYRIGGSDKYLFYYIGHNHGY